MTSGYRGVSPTIMGKFKKRSDMHWARKIWHMGGVGLMAFVYAYVPEKVALTILVLGLLCFIPADFLRQRVPSFNHLIIHFFGPLMREYEEKGLAGTTYLLLGVGFVAFLFPKNITILTLLFLAFADPIASFFGIRYGRDKILGNKSVQGSVAAFSVCAFLTFGYLTYHGFLMDRLVLVSLLAGIIGALAELLPIGKLDDNLSLPVVSATALYVLFQIFGATSSYPGLVN